MKVCRKIKTTFYLLSFCFLPPLGLGAPVQRKGAKPWGLPLDGPGLFSPLKYYKCLTVCQSEIAVWAIQNRDSPLSETSSLESETRSGESEAPSVNQDLPQSEARSEDSETRCCAIQNRDSPLSETCSLESEIGSGESESPSVHQDLSQSETRSEDSEMSAVSSKTGVRLHSKRISLKSGPENTNRQPNMLRI